MAKFEQKSAKAAAKPSRPAAPAPVKAKPSAVSTPAKKPAGKKK